jgi:hypothetical protein
MHLDVSGDSLNDIDLGPLCAQLFIGWVRSGKS